MRKYSIVALFLVALFLFNGCTTAQKAVADTPTAFPKESDEHSSLPIQTVKIPNLSGTDEASAISIILGKGLIPIVEYEYDLIVREGVVIKTEPPAGDEVEDESRIIVFVSIGKESSSYNPSTTVPPDQTVQPTSTPTPNAIVTPTSKPTVTPTSKPTATPTLAPTYTPTPTPTPTPAPNKKITLGSYPQTLVTEDYIISKLNQASGDLPTSDNLYNWIDYNYYISGAITSYMYYQDVDLDRDGIFDYRGVFFTHYRPYACNLPTIYSYQGPNEYYTNIVYWFKYDPIEWDILIESNGKALIIADLVLDSQEYYPSSSTSQFEHNGRVGYANNYELSNIRKFLNEDFYNTAFSDLEKTAIETTEVDNGITSTGITSNLYTCRNTSDKMFLLSYEEATVYYANNTGRIVKGTDYAKVQGLEVNTSEKVSNWWLRSTYDDKYSEGCAASADYIHYGGGISYGCGVRAVNGVRPACWIKP